MDVDAYPRLLPLSPDEMFPYLQKSPIEWV